MLTRVDLVGNTVSTILRDLYLEFLRHDYGNVSDGYQRGLAARPDLDWQSGATSDVATLTLNFGVEFDGELVLELQRLPEVIDAVGGIELENPCHVYVEELTNFSGGDTSAFDLLTGTIHLDGTATMDFVRTRQQDGDGGRVMGQHLVLAAMLEELQTPQLLARTR